ncbi:MAG: alpha/beta hydrolase family protein [Rubrimonas sp.]|uniref:alpha/beta hydrolase family protein n=1 Tax=Rubrimonas sp. TaxID=2036015 RepID=UPI002FDE9743
MVSLRDLGAVLIGAAASLPAAPAAGFEGLDACPPAPVVGAAGPERAIFIRTPQGRIAGALAGPRDSRPVAAVLLLHGYTGARDEIPVAGGEGMFARTARAFAERGVATLRIDFLGSGESDGDWADTTFEGQARDVGHALESLAAEFGPAGARLGALGYSQGGLVALKAAAGGAAFDRIALWNPVLDPADTYGRILGAPTLAEGAARHAAGERRIVGASGLRPAFFADVAAADPRADAAATTAPMLIVAGRDDLLARDGPALATRLAAARAGRTTVIAPEAGHDLGAVSDLALLDAVVACTAEFFADARRP